MMKTIVSKFISDETLKILRVCDWAIAEQIRRMGSNKVSTIESTLVMTTSKDKVNSKNIRSSSCSSSSRKNGVLGIWK